MVAIDTLQRRYGRGALAVGALVGLLLYVAGWPAVARGLVLGSLFSVLNFHLLGRALSRNITGSKGSRRLPPSIARVGRYLLLSVPLVMAVKLPAVDLAATVAGLFMVPMGILGDAVVQHAHRNKSSLG